MGKRQNSETVPGGRAARLDPEHQAEAGMSRYWLRDPRAGMSVVVVLTGGVYAYAWDTSDHLQATPGGPALGRSAREIANALLIDRIAALAPGADKEDETLP